ncbi:MAG: IS3 family transposase, partial [Candidatus Eremiobacterota bacterium]
MKRKQHTPAQIVKKLRDAERLLAAGQAIPDVCKQLEMSEPTYYRWKKEYGGMGSEQLKRLKDLELENGRLKKAVADLTLDNQILKEGGQGKLLSSERRRTAVRQVSARLGVSERRTCAALGVPRATLRYKSKKKPDEDALTQRILELSRLNPRYGYRRIARLLRREGWNVNRKRVHRIWKQEGLKIAPPRKLKRARLGQSENSCVRRRAEYIRHVWSWDFIHDQTSDGQALKILSVVDEYSRECLLLLVERHITAERVLDALCELFRTHGVPEHIRSDNGPEFIANAIRSWLGSLHIGPLYIEPGSPWENAYVESFHSRFRDEFLNRELFTSLVEAQVLIEEFRRHYNEERPHSSIGY